MTKYFSTLPIGSKFNQWEVLSEPFKKGKRYFVKAKCKCNNVFEVNCENLERGITKSCRKCGLSQKKENNPNWQGYGNMPMTAYKLIRDSASKRNIELSIDIKYCYDLMEKQNNKCALTGLIISYNGGTRSSGTASMDRIDSSKGYVYGNVQWVHKDVNLMKNAFNQDYFIEMCKKVVETNNDSCVL